MMDWFRVWHDMPTDPKWRVVARKAGQPLSCVISVFILMLVNASQNADQRGTLLGWDDEDAGAALDMDAEAVAAIRQAMQGKVLHGDHLTGWDRRQPKREDNSSNRVKAFRERQKTQRNGAERDVTQRNATDKSREDTPPITPRKRGSGKHLLPDDWKLPPIAELTPKARECAEHWPPGAYEREGEAFECFWRSRKRMMSDWRLAWANRVIDQHAKIVRGAGFTRSAERNYEDVVLERQRLARAR
jgi:hypothetical protein